MSDKESDGLSVAVIVVVIVVVLLLMLAFFWSCSSGCRSVCDGNRPCSSSSGLSYLAFSAGGLGTGGTAITSTQFWAIGSGSFGVGSNPGDLTTAGSIVDQFASTVAVQTQFTAISYYIRAAAAVAGTLTLALYSSPQSAPSQPAFSAIASAIINVSSSSATYFSGTLTPRTITLNPLDRWVLLLSASNTITVFVLNAGLQLIQS